MEKKDLQRVQGYQNRANGAAFEQLVDLSCAKYEELKIAEIKKIPEPVSILSHPDKQGRFTACFKEKAQPDYRGTYKTGQSLLFEAKHTSQDRARASMVNEEQRRRFDLAEQMNALCFVVVSFSFLHFYRVPWSVWKEMKVKYGRLYLSEPDLAPYEILIRQGVLDFLGAFKNR